MSALTPEQLAQARADLQRWRDIPAPDPHVIAEWRLMVETRNRRVLIGLAHRAARASDNLPPVWR